MCGRTGVHSSAALQLSLLLSSVNYLFRLLRVRIKKDHAPGSTARDGMTFRANRRMAESTHALIAALSKIMWIRRRGYRAVPNQRQPHPGEIVLLLLLREKSQNRKVPNCKLFVNAERAVSSCPSRIPIIILLFMLLVGVPLACWGEQLWAAYPWLESVAAVLSALVMAVMFQNSLHREAERLLRQHWASLNGSQRKE